MNVLKRNKIENYSVKALVLVCFLITGILSVKAQTFDEKVLSNETTFETVPEETKDVLFGKQSPEAILQSISTVDGDRLIHRPVSQMASSLYGTLTGLSVNLLSGNSNEMLDYYLRGGFPLILVDGIPRSSVNIPVEQIESVSVIKDALGTAMLGMMGGNGVLSIVTKKGINQKLKVNFTAQFADSKQLFKPKFVQAHEYAGLLNEALANDGLPAYYSQEDIDKYRSGTNQSLYPNIDWYDYILESSAPVQQYNLSFNGGGSTARYYLDMNYYNQGGFLKDDKSINTYETKDSYKKYSLRTKIDVDVTPSTYFEINAYGQMFKENTPGTALATIYSDLAATPAGAYAPLNPDGSLGGNRIYKNNLYGEAVYTGYRTYNSSDLSLDLRLTQQLSAILEGAYVSALYAYNSIYRETLNRSKPMIIYDYSQNADGSDLYTQLTSTATQANASSYDRQNRMMDFEFDFGYDFTSGKHTSANKILYTYNNYLVQNYLPFNNYGFSGRFQYDYDKRYFAELTASYMGMNQYKEGDRWGFFPALGLGWNLLGEDFLKDKISSLDKLKIRASYGLSGDNLAASYFQISSGSPYSYYNYQRYYESGNSVYFGNAATSASSLTESRLPYLSTWMTAKKLNIGADAALFNEQLSVSLEYFNNNITDVPIERQTNSSAILGHARSLENIGKRSYSGFEITAGYNGVYNDLKWALEGNASLVKSKNIFSDEPNRPYGYMQRTGNPIGQYFGYTAEGLFRSQQEINDYLSNNTIEGYIPVPGDLKYKDLNNDHIIDDRDVSGIGTTRPPVVYGIYGSVSWKGVGLNMQWAGLANRDVMLIDVPFLVNGQGGYTPPTENQTNRWTAANANAEYPRLSAGKNNYNQSASTFWLKDGSYLRLKHLELFYELPESWIKPAYLSRVKLFVAGYNLLTFSGLKDRDPELIDYATIPNTQSISFGINVQF
ncbi:MAG: SusC/RagA family TonB-linked outer membrane protein [Bacteroidales bacterium]|jgi:TonB-linked SusC/RagA family outer membrane protein|nr:SusC/RagA family TonB-linked outer membrane protein [Bacteroidales bacterium]